MSPTPKRTEFKKPLITPLPMKNRAPFVHVDRGAIHVLDNAFVVTDVNGTREHIPVGAVGAVIIAEPGTTVSHKALQLASQTGTIIISSGEQGVRFYSFGSSYSSKSYRMYRQAALALDPVSRVKVARAMFKYRFGEDSLAVDDLTIEQLRGMEGVRVRTLYAQIAKMHRVRWTGRNYNRENFGESDEQNQALSAATACLYGVAECAILASGLSPAFGFVHCGSTRSFVFDVADLFKTDVVNVAFRVVGRGSFDIPGDVRRECRDVFAEKKIMQKIVGVMDEMLDAGGLDDYKFSDDMILIHEPNEAETAESWL